MSILTTSPRSWTGKAWQCAPVIIGAPAQAAPPAEEYQAPPPVAAAPPVPPPADPADQIEHLAQLHASGALTDDEFAAAKAKVLAS